MRKNSFDLRLLSSCALTGDKRKVKNNIAIKRFNENKIELSEIYELIMNEKIALNGHGDFAPGYPLPKHIFASRLTPHALRFTPHEYVINHSKAVSIVLFS